MAEHYWRQLVVSKRGDIWLLSDDVGLVGVSSSRTILDDACMYAWIHKCRNSETLKERFSSSIVFAR